MADLIERGSGRGRLRALGWGGAAALVALPPLAMVAVPEAGFDWGIGDVALAAIVVGGVGLAVELAARLGPNRWYRGGAALALAAGLLLLWSNAAVGYIGEDSPYNILFSGVVAIALIGALAARFRAHGMAVAMASAGLAHALAGAAGLPHDPDTGPITIAFVALWLASAWLFRKAARDCASDRG